MRIPLTWPLGTYGLPMAKSGCPRGTFWHKGWRFHDTEDNSPSNHWSNPYDLAGRVSKSNMEQKFCMKTKHRTSDYNLGWPEGNTVFSKKEIARQVSRLLFSMKSFFCGYFLEQNVLWLDMEKANHFIIQLFSSLRLITQSR